MHVDVLGLRDEAWVSDAHEWEGVSVEAFAVRPPRALGRAPGLRRSLIIRPPDLVHTHGIWAFTSSDVVAWSDGRRPYIVSPHGMLDPWALSLSRWKKWLGSVLFESRHLAGASCLHALNEAEARAIRGFGLRAPIAVIPNGIDVPTMLHAEVYRRRADESLHRELLYLGRLHPKKNVHGLLKAFAIIAGDARAKGWRLKIVGEGSSSYKKILAEIVDRKNLASIVTFTGLLKGARKAAAYRDASAFVLPSFSEGLPMSVLEAWSYGLPVAMTSECNLVEGFSYQAACQIESAPEVMAGQLADFLFQKPGELARMGAYGRDLVSREYSWNAVGKQFSEVYHWALGRGDTPVCVNV
jgi:poly(glycerol-phosphate) alpha-glucosyltransferase